MSAYNDAHLLEQMELSQLEQLLHQELEKDSKADPQRVKALLSAIDHRQEAYSFTDDANVQAACEKYRARQGKSVARKQRVRRFIGAAVAAMLLLAVIPQAAQAQSVWDMLAHWTESVFAFFSREDDGSQQPKYRFHTDHPGLQQVYDAVAEMGVHDPVVPTWVPEGYELVDCEFVETRLYSYVHSRLIHGEKELVFDVTYHTDSLFSDYYKDENEVEKWERNGIVHYIMKNNDDLVAVWTRENVECFLSVDCQEDVLYEILESIYLTEDD